MNPQQFPTIPPEGGIMVSNHCLDQLVNRILDQVMVCPSPARRMVEALLWRGYLVQPLGAGEVVTVDDYEAEQLRELPALRIQPIGPDACSVIAQPHEDESVALRSILAQPGPPDGRWTSIGLNFCSWPAFRRRNYGCRLHAADLDVSTALLTRVLPILGVATRHSGHGDGNRWFLRIRCDGIYSSAWLQFLWENELRHIVSQDCARAVRFSHEEEGPWVRQMHSGKGGHGFRPSWTREDELVTGDVAQLEFGPETASFEDAFRMATAAQELGRTMLDQPRAAEVRRRRRAIFDSLPRSIWPADLTAACVAQWGDPVWPRASSEDTRTVVK